MKVKCLICGDTLESFHVFPRKALFSNPLTQPASEATATVGIAYCPHCRHISSAQKSSYDSGQLEQEIYGEHYKSCSMVSLSPSQKRYDDFVADWIAARLPKGSRVLEIGSYDGYFLHLLKERGFDCHGVEPSPFADFAATHYSLPIVKGFFSASGYEPESFDLVIAKHVVEHVPDPVGFVRDIGAVLKKGGLFYLEVPNSLISLEQTYFFEFHIEHISYFTPASVVALLKECNISDLLHFETPVYGYLKFPFICLLARKNSTIGSIPNTYFQDFSINSLIARFVSEHNRYERNIAAIPGKYKLAVWGAGSVATQYAIDGRWTPNDVTVVDINQANHGKFLSVTGHKVMPVETINSSDRNAVLIASGWEDDVEQQIRQHVSRKVRVLRFADLIR